MTSQHILITGADGYLGYSLLRKYLTETDARLTLLLNANNNERANHKVDRLLQRLDSDVPGLRSQRDITLVFADLADCRGPEIACKSSITSVIHAAAITRFDVSANLAQAVNVAGTRRMLEVARHCPALEKFCLVSSIYASGLLAGLIPEDFLDGTAGFANNYERSKWSAERLMHGEFSDLPWQICRVGLIAADDDTGTVSGINALHNTLKLFYYGLLSVLSGDPTMPLYMVTAEYATASVRAAIQSGSTHTFFNLSHQRQEAITLDAFVDVAFREFRECDEFRRRNILKPLYSDYDTFEILAKAMTEMGRGLMQTASASIRPFARQMFVSKKVCNENASRLLPNYRAPDMTLLVRNICRHLIENSWRRAHEKQPEAQILRSGVHHVTGTIKANGANGR